MKKLAIIGSDGMLGSDLVRYLASDFQITSITRKNYSHHIGDTFDICINANGNSRRFWANEHPLEDFQASTVSVAQSIKDFPSDLYIYISSPDVYKNHTKASATKENQEISVKDISFYGFHKHLSELIVKKHTHTFHILRCAMILGKKMKKGPLYDIKNDQPLFISKDSKMQFITTFAIADIVQTLLKSKVTNQIINIGGIGTFSFTKLGRYFDKKIEVRKDATKQVYEMNIEKIRSIYPNLKTSEEYLQEFLKEYK